MVEEKLLTSISANQNDRMKKKLHTNDCIIVTKCSLNVWMIMDKCQCLFLKYS